MFLITRAALLLLGWRASSLLDAPGPNPSVLPRHDVLAHAWQWTSPWFRFDTSWYVRVADHGYHWGGLGVADTNFMPLYPALIRIFQPLALGSPWLAAWIVANLAALAAFIVLWEWAIARFGLEIGTRTLLLVVIFPFAFFFMTPYAESLFLALAVAAFVLVESDRWVLAACTAGLSTIARPVGAAVVLALVVLALSRGRRREAVIAAISIGPLVAFAVYLGLAFGHPLGFLTYHSAGWVPPHGGLGATVASQFQTKLSPWDRVDVAVTVLFLGSVPFIWRRLGPAYAAYAFIGVALPLVHGLVSMERYVIVLFPAMACWATWKSRTGQAVLFCLSALGLIVATVLFATGYSIF
ncbi:MAG TPA: hypothetical protein VF221_20030 [Chloroflexota bacterium]